MKIINRTLQQPTLTALHNFPAIYINGPRQAGKTTLVKNLLTNDFPARFITFDDTLELAAAKRNPLGYLKLSGTPLILDEIQRVPELFYPLKQLIDEQRQAALHSNHSANGHYLLTGSANLAAMPELTNAMVGRMATLTLLPLSVCETQGTQSQFLKRCFTQDFSAIKANDDLPLSQAMRKASFPELMNKSDSVAANWFHNYMQKITLEDPRHIYNMEKAAYMPVLLQSLAARAGNLINDASLGREVGLNAVTTRHYRQLLSHTFVTHTIKPWHRNITKRLVKASKLYFLDTRLLCYLLNSTPEQLAKAQPQRFGHVLENFIASELMKANYASGEEIDISFYQTNDGREVDFVLTKHQKLVALEVKHAERITDKDLRGIKELQRAAGSDFYCGIILCNTPRVIAFDNNIYLLPFSALWEA